MSYFDHKTNCTCATCVYERARPCYTEDDWEKLKLDHNKETIALKERAEAAEAENKRLEAELAGASEDIVRVSDAESTEDLGRIALQIEAERDALLEWQREAMGFLDDAIEALSRWGFERLLEDAKSLRERAR